MLDLSLAYAHHLLFIGIFVLLGAELLLIRQGMGAADVARVGRIDSLYGLFALAVLAVGFARAIYAAKGWEYYSANPFFHAKMVAFILAGLLSIVPTVKIIQWRRRGGGAAAAEISLVRRVLWGELALLGSMPFFAAAMARGSSFSSL
jgi:putative membrane protein